MLGKFASPRPFILVVHEDRAPGAVLDCQAQLAMGARERGAHMLRALRAAGFFGKLNWEHVVCSAKHHVIPAKQQPPERRHQATRHSTALPSMAKTTRSRIRTGAPTAMPSASATSRRAAGRDAFLGLAEQDAVACGEIYDRGRRVPRLPAREQATGIVTSSTRWMRPHADGDDEAECAIIACHSRRRAFEVIGRMFEIPPFVTGAWRSLRSRRR
jgi:hypothetical protein